MVHFIDLSNTDILGKFIVMQNTKTQDIIGESVKY